MAATLLGCDGVRLYHDQGLFKEPFGGPTPWHQDQYYWPFVEDVPTITMWMPMVDVPAEIGTMTFASGSHLEPSLRGPGISDESQATFGEQLRERPAASPTAPWPPATPRSTPDGRCTRRPATPPTRCGGDDGDLRGRRRSGRDGASPAQDFDRKVWLTRPPGSHPPPWPPPRPRG